MQLTRGVVTATTALALVVAIAGCSGGSSKSSGSASISAPGRILTYDDPDSKLVTERADGTGRTMLPGSVSQVPSSSADNTYLLTNSGAGVAMVTGSGVKNLRSPFKSVNTQDFPSGLPFLDHNKYVLRPRGSGRHGAVTAVPIGGGKAVNLGTGSDESGDPSAKAAYVIQAVGSQVTDFAEQGALIQPDGQIDRDVAGQQPHTLVTAKQIDQLAGLDSRVHLTMYATSSPDGSEVLVTADTIDATAAQSLLIAMTPSGHVIARIVGAHLDGGYWSPDGKRIAYFNTASHKLIIWTPDSNTSTSIAVPSQPSPWYSCLWSPDQTWLVCAGGEGVVRGDPTGRLIVDLATHQTATTKATDEPVAWLPSAS